MDSIAALARREGLNEEDKETFVVQQVGGISIHSTATVAAAAAAASA